ncbi:hypothetical protein [Staphylococcus caeli]|uniref:Uncharacterized protein n=1 Tax=Staphylococcus caeli TaxID=2201815 RepID=A0A1D4K4Z3_9STAP|nr:hypothetical protein [Staphylococcus caeli]SCS68993.1 Uncharacterised protein [Staphylococcus caeli]SCT49247.1 Uncharacterised protein [Staphylococcus caeli]
MKKVLASLGVILLVAILGIAVVFAYGSYKDLELKKEEAKVTDQKKKDSGNKTSEKEQQSQVDEQSNQASTNTNNIQSNNTNEELNTEEVRTTEDGEEIKKTKNGIDYTGDFNSPEEEAQYEKNVMSQSGGAPTQDEDIDKDWDPDAEYAKQKKIYDMQARGEIGQPGETINSNSN